MLYLYLFSPGMVDKIRNHGVGMVTQSQEHSAGIADDSERHSREGGSLVVAFHGYAHDCHLPFPLPLYAWTLVDIAEIFQEHLRHTELVDEETPVALVGTLHVNPVAFAPVGALHETLVAVIISLHFLSVSVDSCCAASAGVSKCPGSLPPQCNTVLILTNKY